MDIGANIGWTTMRLATLALQGTILAFEPDPLSRTQLLQHLALNQIKNVKVFPYAAGNQEKTCRLEVRDDSNHGMNRISPEPGVQGHLVKTVRLDEFEPTQNLRRLDLVKIDVEGYEVKVIQGAIRLIQKFMPALFIEVDDKNLRDQGNSPGELVEILRKAGYRAIHRNDTGESVHSRPPEKGCHFDIIARKDE